MGLTSPELCLCLSWCHKDAGIGSAVAAFLVAMGDYHYFQTSSSVVGADPWTDAGWCWHPLYDLKCGAPRAGVIRESNLGLNLLDCH